MKKKLLLSGLVLLFCPISAQAHSEGTVHEIKQYWDEKNGVYIEEMPDIPQTAISQKKRTVLPEKFDYTSGNFETMMRNQWGLGICWAYSGVDTVSISHKKEFGVEYTLSPNYYNFESATNAFSDSRNPAGYRLLNDGGSTHQLLVKYALGNTGVLENTFPTPQRSVDNPAITSSVFKDIASQKVPVYVEDLVKIQGVSYSSFTEEQRLAKLQLMKENLYKNGVVTISIHESVNNDARYFNNATNACYVPLEAVHQNSELKEDNHRTKTNHAVIIVGWDDNYSKDNFATKPKNDGAFIIKNSYGESEGQGKGVGYYHVSYEDLFVQTRENYSVDTKQEQYDNFKTYVNSTPTGSGNLTSSSREAYMANTFTAGEAKEELKAVSFYSEQYGVDYEIYYTDTIPEKHKAISLTGMTLLKSGTVETSGLKEIEVPTIEINPNQEYTIIVKITYPEDINAYDVSLQAVKDSAKGEYPHLDKGQSFVSSEFNNRIIWRAVSEGDYYSSKYNVFLNAYTNTMTPASSVKVTPETFSLATGQSQALTAVVLPENATNKDLTWESSNPSVASVDTQGVVTALATGEATITATTADTISGTSKVTVTEAKPATSIKIRNKKEPYIAYLNQAQKIDVDILPNDATQRELVFESADSTIAAINENGEITGKSFGETTIKVSLKENPTICDTMKVVTDDHGDTEQTATEVKLAELMHGTYDVKFQLRYYEDAFGGDADYFRFVAPEDGNYVIHGSATRPTGKPQDYFDMYVKVDGESKFKLGDYFDDFTTFQLKKGQGVTWAILGTYHLAPMFDICLVDTQVGTKYNFFVEKEENIQYGNVELLRDSVVLGNETLNLQVGDQIQLSAQVVNTNILDPFYKNIRWRSNSSSIAEVNYQTGLVTIKGKGTVFITAENAYGGFSIRNKISKSIAIVVKN